MQNKNFTRSKTGTALAKLTKLQNLVRESVRRILLESDLKNNLSISYRSATIKNDSNFSGPIYLPNMVVFVQPRNEVGKSVFHFFLLKGYADALAAGTAPDPILSDVNLKANHVGKAFQVKNKKEITDIIDSIKRYRTFPDIDDFNDKINPLSPLPDTGAPAADVDEDADADEDAADGGTAPAEAGADSIDLQYYTLVYTGSLTLTGGDIFKSPDSKACIAVDPNRKTLYLVVKSGTDISSYAQPGKTYKNNDTNLVFLTDMIYRPAGQTLSSGDTLEEWNLASDDEHYSSVYDFFTSQTRDSGGATPTTDAEPAGSGRRRRRRTVRPEVIVMQGLIGMPAAERDGIWGGKTETAYEQFIIDRHITVAGPSNGIQDVKDDWKTFGPQITSVTSDMTHGKPVTIDKPFTDDTQGVLEFFRVFSGLPRDGSGGDAASGADDETGASQTPSSAAASGAGAATPGALGVYASNMVQTRKGLTRGKHPGSFKLQNVYMFNDGTYGLNKPDVELNKTVPIAVGPWGGDHFAMKALGGDYILIPIKKSSNVQESRRYAHWTLQLLSEALVSEPGDWMFVALQSFEWTYESHFQSYGPGGVDEIKKKITYTPAATPKIKGVNIVDIGTAKAEGRSEGGLDAIELGIRDYIAGDDLDRNPIGIPLYLTPNMNSEMNSFPAVTTSTF